MRKIGKLINNVDDEKLNRIINSALEEFSKNEYHKASTNTIVKNAGVSKGLLYHYFDTKENLYKYLQKFAIEITMKRISEELDWEQKDIFLRIKEVSMIKLRIFNQYPYLLDFSLSVFKDNSVEEILKISEEFNPRLYMDLYTYNIDFSLFKEDIDIKKSINIIRWTLEKYSEEKRNALALSGEKFDFKAVESEIYEYIDMLKKAFFK